MAPNETPIRLLLVDDEEEFLLARPRRWDDAGSQ